jgi:hypothetical protein
MGSAAWLAAEARIPVSAKIPKTMIPTLTIDFIFMPPSSKDKGFGLRNAGTGEILVSGAKYRGKPCPSQDLMRP